MKKRRPPRPRKRKATISVEAKRKVEALSSVKVPVSGDPPVGKEKHDATISRLAASAKTIGLADQVDTVGGISKARGWKIFAGLIVSFLLVASAVVLFATHWT
jgi:hypothetical protein